jgi:hypothetical protein
MVAEPSDWQMSEGRSERRSTASPAGLPDRAKWLPVAELVARGLEKLRHRREIRAADHAAAAAAGVRVLGAEAVRMAARTEVSEALVRSYPLTGHWLNDANDPKQTFIFQ